MSNKILVIDDHKETLELVTLVLKKQGYRVYTAQSGRAGLNLAIQDKPDLVLLDAMMPDMDGFSVCREIRKHPKLSTVPVIMLTAKSQADEKWEGFQAGATDYLIKPTNAEELNKRVNTILENKQTKEPTTPVVAAAPKAPSSSGTPEHTVITQSPLSRGQIIAFVGARGGVGTTLSAINMAFTLSLLKSTTIVDFDMRQGHIALYLNQKVVDGLNELAAGSHLSIRAQIPNVTTPLTPNLYALLSAPNLAEEVAIFKPSDVQHLCDAIQQTGRTIVIDCGTGINPVNRPMLERADQVVICTRPERVSLSGTRMLLNAFEELLMPTTQVGVLLNEFDSDLSIPTERIEQFLKQPLLGIVTLSKEKVTKAVNSAKPLVVAYPKDGYLQQYTEIAQKVVTI